MSIENKRVKLFLSKTNNKYKKILEEIKKLKKVLKILPSKIDETKENISRSQKDIVDLKRQKEVLLVEKRKNDESEYYKFTKTNKYLRNVDEEITNLNSYLNVLNIRLEDLVNNLEASKQMIKDLEQQKYEMETLETVVRRKKVPPGVDKNLFDFFNEKENTLSPNLRF